MMLKSVIAPSLCRSDVAHMLSSPLPSHSSAKAGVTNHLQRLFAIFLDICRSLACLRGEGEGEAEKPSPGSASGSRMPVTSCRLKQRGLETVSSQLPLAMEEDMAMERQNGPVRTHQ